MKTWVEKLDRHGLWNGPEKFLVRRMVRADQVKRSSAFIGSFEENAFDGVRGLEGATIVNLGVPGPLWQLREGIDRIRNSSDELQIYKKPNYENQFIEPEVFNKIVQINGLTPVGLEIACQLTKMGVKSLALYDPGTNSESEICLSRYKNPKKRIEAAKEIVGGVAKYHEKYIDGEFGDIIINASSDLNVRKSLWRLIKGNEKIGFYIDAQVVENKGKIFAFKPSDKEGIEIYEMDLGTSQESTKSIAYMTGLIGSFATMIFTKYMITSGNARHVVLDRVFHLDTDMLMVGL